MKLLIVMTFLLSLSGGAFAQNQTVGNGSVTAAQIMTQVGLKSSAEILKHLEMRTFAKFDSSNKPIGCYVQTLPYGRCEKAFISSVTGSTCLKRRLSAPFLVKPVFASSVTLNDFQKAALRTSYAKMSTQISSFANPANIADRARVLFLAEAQKGRCGALQQNTIYQSFNLASISTDQIGSGPNFKVQIYTSNLSPSGRICLTDVVVKPVLNANCVPESKPIKLPVAICNRVWKMLKAKNMQGSVGGVAIPAPVLPATQEVVAQYQLASALESPRVVAAMYDVSSNEPELAQELFIEDQLKPVFPTLTTESAVNTFLSQDVKNFAVAIDHLAAIDHHLALTGAPVSSLGSFAQAYSYMKGHVALAPVFQQRELLFDKVSAVLPKDTAELNTAFNNNLASELIASPLPRFWGLQEGASLSLIKFRPKNPCHIRNSLNFQALDAATLNEIQVATPQVLQPVSLSSDVTYTKDLGAAYIDSTSFRNTISAESGVPVSTLQTYEETATKTTAPMY